MTYSEADGRPPQQDPLAQIAESGGAGHRSHQFLPAFARMHDESESQDEIVSLLEERWKALAGGWAGIAALGAFGLQAAGFLSLRFHLAALGVPADLGLLDARYLFEGANFLVFILTALSSVLLLLLMVAAIGWLLGRLIPKRFRSAVVRRVATWWQERVSPRLSHSRIACLGVVFALVLVQFVLRQCLQVENLLLASEPPKTRWLATLLLAESEVPLSLFLGAALLAIGATLALWLASERAGKKSLSSRLLGLLLLLEIVLVPINYGVLTANRPMERLSDFGTLTQEGEAWLVWEEEHRLVVLSLPDHDPFANLTPPVGANPFLRFSAEARKKAAAERRIVLILRDKADVVRISGRESLLRRLIGGSQ